MRRTWLIAGGVGFVAGVIATLVVVALFPPDTGYKTMMGPVGIVSPGESKHGYLGAAFSNEPGRSLFVARVSRAAAGDSDQLMAGDRVTSINGRAVATFDEFQEVMAQSKPGDVVELGIVRGAQAMTLRVRLLSYAEMRSQEAGGSGGPSGGP